MLFLVIIRLLNPRWATFNTQAVLSWDIIGYYLYLPATFLYGDMTQFSFMPDIMETYRNTGSYYQAFQVDNGNFVIKYPIGMALCYFPFFLLGDFGAWITGHAHDGFSAPYQFAIGMGALVYAAIGLHYLRKILLRYFDDIPVALALIWLVFGTNYMQYVSLDGAMPHGYLFTFYSLVLFLTIQWHETKELKHALLIGLLIGWATIIRPTEVLMSLIPLLWGVYSLDSLKKKLLLVKENSGHVLGLIITASLVISIQLVYWKIITGDFLFYSYEDQGFDWKTPHFYEVLFGFRKGVFVYTPLTMIGFIGLFFIFRKAKEGALSLTSFFIINLYVVCSWAIWWYAGSYSCRAIVQSYPILIFGAAAFFVFFAKSKKRLIPLMILLLPFIALNLKQLWQYNKGIIHAEEMRKLYFYSLVTKIWPTQDDMILMDVKETIKDESLYTKTLIEAQGFEQDSLFQRISKGTGPDGSNTWISSPDYKLSPKISIPLNSDLQKPDQWIKATTRFKAGWGAGRSWLVVTRSIGDEVKLWRAVRMHHVLTPGETWNEIYFYYPIPLDEDLDSLEVFVQNDDETRFWIDEIKAELMVPK